MNIIKVHKGWHNINRGVIIVLWSNQA